MAIEPRGQTKPERGPCAQVLGANARACLSSLLAVLTTVLVATAHGEDIRAFDPETGYRIARYRAPTAATVPGGTRIDSDELDRLMARDDVVLIDVTPAGSASVDPDAGRWRLGKPHQNIPGSHWLPDVGFGQLDAAMTHYLASTLDRLAAGDKARPLIFYCQADCWMSWNAVKRAASLGYRKLYWYAEGIDGWRDLDRSFAPAEPVPLTRP